MERFDIFLIGVGGQGIGLLSEAILRAVDYAGFSAIGVDTHGLAQRGGTVTSHVRIGVKAHNALIKEGTADMVVSLERHEALRGMNTFLKDNGTLIYYDAVWQPLPVRLGREAKVEPEVIAAECKRRNVKEYRIFLDDLDSAKMQNTVLLAKICSNNLVPGIKAEHYKQALTDLMSGKLLEENLKLFDVLNK